MFFNAGNIAAADAQHLRRLLLGARPAPKAVPHPHDRPLPGRQGVHQPAQPGSVGPLLAVGFHLDVIGQGVGQRQLPASLQRLLQADLHPCLAHPPQLHTEFVRYPLLTDT